jgi:GAF domain-containing protein
MTRLTLSILADPQATWCAHWAGRPGGCHWTGGLGLAAFEAHVDQSPLLAHQRATGDDGPVKISDFLTRDRFHRLALYAEFYRNLPVEHHLAFGLPSPDGRVIGIALNSGRGDFTEADRDLLAALRAPLARATIRARSWHRPGRR